MGDLSLPSTVMKRIVKFSKTPNTDHGHEQLAMIPSTDTTDSNNLSKKDEGSQREGYFFKTRLERLLMLLLLTHLIVL